MKQILFFVIILLTIVGCGQQKKEAVIKTTQDLRLMTYNIRNGHGMDDSLSYSRVAAVIKQAAPDVVAVQEVDSVTGRSAQVYVLGELANQTGMIPVYAPAIDYDGGKYGIGLLCKEKPLSVRRVSLPGREEARTLVMAEFPTYCYVCTHLSLTEEDRMASLPILKEILLASDKPLFIAGDWNDVPESVFIQTLQKDYYLLTSPKAHTYPASEPETTIDYIAVGQAWKQQVNCKKAEVIAASVESDHRPIVVDITVESL